MQTFFSVDFVSADVDDASTDAGWLSACKSTWFSFADSDDMGATAKPAK